MRANRAPQHLLAPEASAGTPGIPPSAVLPGAVPQPLQVLSFALSACSLSSDSVSLSPPASSLRRLLPLGRFIPPSASASWARALRFGAREKPSGKHFLPPWGLTRSPRSVLCPLPPPSLCPSSLHCSRVRGVCGTNLRVSFLAPCWVEVGGGGVPAAHKSGPTFWFGGPWGRECWARAPQASGQPGAPAWSPQPSMKVGGYLELGDKGHIGGGRSKTGRPHSPGVGGAEAAAEPKPQLLGGG